MVGGNVKHVMAVACWWRRFVPALSWSRNNGAGVRTKLLYVHVHASMEAGRQALRLHVDELAFKTDDDSIRAGCDWNEQQ